MKSLFGIHTGQLVIRDDILAPIDEQWNVDK